MFCSASDPKRTARSSGAESEVIGIRGELRRTAYGVEIDSRGNLVADLSAPLSEPSYPNPAFESTQPKNCPAWSLGENSHSVAIFVLPRTISVSSYNICKHFFMVCCCVLVLFRVCSCWCLCCLCCFKCHGFSASHG